MNEWPSGMEEREGIEQERIKSAFLSGAMSSENFLKEVFRLDQSDASRSEAANNAKLLSDPEVKQALEREEATGFGYQNLLSLSHFHAGQQAAVKNPEAARASFISSLEAAEQVEDEKYEDWKRYVRATIAYLEKDLPSLETLHAELADGANKQIVSNLLSGLKKRGAVDYGADYEKE